MKYRYIILLLLIIGCGENGHHQEFFASGRLKSEGNYKKDKKDGLWIDYYDYVDAISYNIKRINITYKDGIKHGAYVFYNKKGDVLEEGNYNNDKKDGLWLEYFGKTMLKKSEVMYKDGDYAGIYREWWNDGNTYIKRQEGQFDTAGLKQGLWTFYNRTSGKKISEGNYKNGENVGSWIEWHNWSEKKLVEEHYDSEGNLFLVEKWDENCSGKIAEETYFEDGARAIFRRLTINHKSASLSQIPISLTKVKTWACSGDKTGEGNYKNGKKVGTWKSWNKFGSGFDYEWGLSEESIYNDQGVQIKWTKYKTNFEGVRIKSAEIFYNDNGKKDGESKNWDRMGRLTQSFYVNGVKQ